jgi:hypothetical protein
MLRIWAHGTIVQDNEGLGTSLQAEAAQTLRAGYGSASRKELDRIRHQTTDLLDDLIGSGTADESVFTAAHLGIALSHLRLLVAGAWLGRGKWMYREVSNLDPEWSDALTHALRKQAQGDAGPLVDLAEATLAQSGGRLFDGYSEHESEP